MQTKIILTLLATTITSSAFAQLTLLSSGSAPVLDRSNNLIVNGSFENGGPSTTTGDGITNYFVPQSSSFQSALPGWNVSGGAGASLNDARWGDTTAFSSHAIINGNNALYFGGGAATSVSVSPTGVSAEGQYLFPSTPTFTTESGYGQTTVSQTLTGLTIGAHYNISFWASGNYSFAIAEGSIDEYYDGIFRFTLGGYNPVDLVVPGGSSVTEPNSNPNGFDPGPQSEGNFRFGRNAHRYTFDFVALSSTQALTFSSPGVVSTGYIDSLMLPFHPETTNWNQIPLGQGATLVLDDVIVNRVQASTDAPEPGTLALLSLGGGSLLLLRKRKK